jgi:hypothetical protein
VIIAQINPAFEPVAASATALVAASVIVTAILVPIITALYAKRYGNMQERMPNRSDRNESLTHRTKPLSLRERGGVRDSKNLFHHPVHQPFCRTEPRHAQRDGLPVLRH